MTRTPLSPQRLLLPLALMAGSVIACESDPAPSPLSPDAVPPGTDAARAGYPTPGVHRQYGPPVKLGDGMARAYVVLDARSGQAPLEVGIALDDRALEGLSATEPSIHTVPLPAQAPPPYEFVMLDWNPGGHEPPGVYDLPHFDFHFYLVPEADLMGIQPSDPDFAAKANNLPMGDEVPQFYTVLAPPGLSPADVAVPAMGVHWVDTRSPELQTMFGNPDGFEPFTTTFIYGSWDGRFTFLEPMITRAFLLGQPDEVRAVPQPAIYPEPGWYPAAYRIQWDPQPREYRIGLIELSRHE